VKRPRLTWRRLPWWAEVVTIAAGYAGYEVLRALSPTRVDTAAAHAHSVLTVERWVHMDGELAADHWLNARHVLSLAGGYYYGTMHFLVTPIVLGLMWWRRPEQYPWLRSALVLTSLVCLVVFWAWPVAPPRFAQPGSIDTLVTRHLFGTANPHGVSGLINEYAAMPSLHVGWALWCAAAVVVTARSRWRHLAWLYPLATTADVISTGNHFVLDCVAGALLVTVMLWLTGPIDGQSVGSPTVSTSPARVGGFNRSTQHRVVSVVRTVAGRVLRLGCARRVVCVAGG
jgi:PAP2 superfamily protein